VSAATGGEFSGNRVPGSPTNLGFAEPWYLLVPPWTRAHWSPAEIVAGYRQRMQLGRSSRARATSRRWVMASQAYVFVSVTARKGRRVAKVIARLSLVNALKGTGRPAPRSSAEEVATAAATGALRAPTRSARRP
jgi:hypothetical protein